MAVHFVLCECPLTQLLYVSLCMCLCCSMLVTATGSRLPFHAVERVEGEWNWTRPQSSCA